MMNGFFGRMKIRALTAGLMAVFAMMLILHVSSLAEEGGAASPLPVRVLLLPKFEIGEIAGDFPGEAQYFYEQYLMGAEEYEIPCGIEENRLYYKDGIALYMLGEGKVNAALNTMAVLSDPRFDFSRAYVLSTGCAGSAIGTTVMGDVFVITAAVDYDLGHHADGRDIADHGGTTWFHDPAWDSASVVVLNREVTDKVYGMVKDTPVGTTERTRNFMRNAFDGANWAVRDPMVLQGTTVTGDNYWKGVHGHENALLMTETYRCPDPYVTTEMEDVAVALTVKRMGFLDRLIVLRVSVNTDVFMLDATPESLWGGAEGVKLADEESVEAVDIFETAMKNICDVGRIIIDAILDGRF